MSKAANLAIPAHPTKELVIHPTRAEHDKYFPRLEGEDFRVFLADIEERGISQPLIVSQRTHDTVIVDGHERLAAALELGLDTVPVIIMDFATEADEVFCFANNNLRRRHLTIAQRHYAIDCVLMNFTGYSNRQLASEIGVSHHTVQARRKRLEQTGTIEPAPRRQSADGKTRPAELDSEAIDEALLDAPHHSNRRLAEQLGVSHHTVQARRDILTHRGIIPQHDTREASDGKQHPSRWATGQGAQLPTSAPNEPPATAPPQRDLSAARGAIKAAAQHIRGLEPEDINALRTPLIDLYQCLTETLDGVPPEHPAKHATEVLN